MYTIKFDEMNEHKRRELHKLIVADSDIVDTIYAVRLFIKEVDGITHPLFMPLQETIIISYARPFTDNEPFGTLSKKYCKFSSQRLADLHKKMIDTRNHYIAHSDSDVRRVTIIPPGTKNYGEYRSGRSKDIGFEITNKRFEIATFTDILELCQDVGSSIHKDVNKLLDELFPSSSNPGSPIELIHFLDGDPIITPYSHTKEK